MEKNRVFATTSGGKEYLPQATDLMVKSFRTDPAIRYMLSHLSDADREAYYPSYMHTLLKAGALNGGIFSEANDFQSCAVWLLPGKRVDNPFTIVQAGFIGCIWKLGIPGIKRMLIEFDKESRRVKDKGLRDKKGNQIKRYHYLWFIGTDPEARGQGLASRLIAQREEQVAGDNIPIWLEATTERSRDVYAKQGFEVVDVMRLGQGTHNADGIPEKGGPGISIFAMIWKPKDKQKGAAAAS